MSVGTVSEAIEKLDSFRPDALILDSQVGGESGLKVLDALPEDSEIRAIILTRGKEVIPKDTAFIKGCIQKPFKSDDVTEKVRQLAEEMDIKRSKDKRFKFKLFSKQPKQVSEEEISGARFGKSYVIFESEPSSVYKLAWYFMMKDCNVRVISRDFLIFLISEVDGNFMPKVSEYSYMNINVSSSREPCPAS